MQDGEAGEATPDGGADDPALREWAQQAAAVKGSELTNGADPTPDERAANAEPPVTPSGTESFADATPPSGGRGGIPWFLPGGNVPPEPEDQVDADADAPISARSWNEADIWTLPRDGVDAGRAVRNTDPAPSTRLEGTAWAVGLRAAEDLAHSGAAAGVSAPAGLSARADRGAEDAPAGAPSSSAPDPAQPGDGVEEARSAEVRGFGSITQDGALSPEEILRGRIMSAPAGRPRARGERPRLTPATLAALVLLVTSAVLSFAFMLWRGGGSLPTPAARPPAALASGTAAPSAALSPGVTATAIATPTPAATGATSSGPASTPSRTLAPVATIAPSATPVPAATLLADRHYDDADAAITYAGSWGSATGAGYTGGAVTWASTAGATATLNFTGRTITWFGPVGPTRGSATVFIDGTAAGTVNAFAGSFSARNSLFTHDFGSVGPHTIRIVVAGTADHPTVAIDELVAGA